MHSSTTTARRVAALALASVLAGGLASCSSDKTPPKAEGTGSQSPSASDSASASDKPSYDDYLKVPKGVHLTLRGTKLGLGESATMAWQPAAKVTASLKIKVDKVDKADIKVLADWTLDKDTKSSQPYFVHASVRNVGKRPLAPLTVPIYAVITGGSYVTASSFESEFKPCPSTPLPKKFKPGKKLDQCWVFLAPDHGKLTGVAFYPGPWFEPIMWQGKVDTYQPPKDTKKGN